MMDAIWKFELEITDHQVIEMPGFVVPLAVGEQYGQLVMWALVSTRSPTKGRNIRIFGTGQEVDLAGEFYLGTVTMPNGLVWHVFDADKPPSE